MKDMWKTKLKLGIKSGSVWQDKTSKWELNEDGTVGKTGLCGHWDFEIDKFGYCRDEDCRYNRIVAALQNGEAMKLKDGTLIWTPGFKIRKG